MIQWLYDTSNHQRVTPNLNGWAGLIAKASEGSGFRDGMFATHRANTLGAGKLFAAYHFLRSDSSPDAQVETFLSVAGPDDPLIPDVESIKKNGTVVSAPTLAQTREFIRLLRARGRHVPMIYLPRWYWETWGRPDISDLPPVWPSRYPDYVLRSRESGWALVGPQEPFGGCTMSGLVQFTSTPLDQNAYSGTLAQLTALLRGEEDNMPNINQADLDVLLAGAHKVTTNYRVTDGDPARPLPLDQPDDVVGHVMSERARLEQLVESHRIQGTSIANIETVVNKILKGLSELAVGGQTQEGFDALFRTSSLTPGLLREGSVFVDNDPPKPPTGG